MKDSTTQAGDRVPWQVKTSYGLGSVFDMWGHWLYPTIAFQIFGLYLHVPEWQIGIAVIFSRVFDAFSDLFFGWISDNTRSRLGRRRPYMFVGSILAGVGLPLLLAVTPGWGSSRVFGAEISRYFWFMVGSSAFYLPIVSCFNMPYSSLGNELTPDYHERTSIYAYRNAVQKIGEVGLYFFGLFFSMAAWSGANSDQALACVKKLLTSRAAWLLAPEGAAGNTLLGAQVYLVVCGLFMVVAGLLCTLGVRERYYGTVIEGRQPWISIATSLRQTLTCRPFLCMQLMNTVAAMAQSMVGVLGFALTLYHVCGGNKPLGNLWNFWMGAAGMVLGLLGVVLFAALARRCGKHTTLMIVFTFLILIFSCSWWLYTPAVPWLQLVVSGSLAMANAGQGVITGAMYADVIDYDELQGGNRREGAFSACNSWFMKVGMALGAGFSYFVLGWIGFDSHANQQSSSTLAWIRFLFGAIPVAGTFLAVLVLRLYPLTHDKMREIRLQLETRRGRV
jgi:GPH family glycoside/pentoside/hexuronide:cation symporter